MTNKIKLVLRIVFIMAIFQSTNVYSKTYFCGITGELIQSQQPCEKPKTDPLISPIKTNHIDKKVIDKTVSMLREATLNRDISAIERLLSDKFIFKSNEGSWDGRELFNTDKQGFVNVMTEHLLAMTKYEQVIERYSIKTLDNELVAETVSVEKVELGEKQIIARLLERIQVVSVDGFAQVDSIKQIELK